jgi:hypothetical protein
MYYPMRLFPPLYCNRHVFNLIIVDDVFVCWFFFFFFVSFVCRTRSDDHRSIRRCSTCFMRDLYTRVAHLFSTRYVARVSFTLTCHSSIFIFSIDIDTKKHHECTRQNRQNEIIHRQSRSGHATR